MVVGIPYKVPRMKRERYDSMEFPELLDARNMLAMKTYCLSDPNCEKKTRDQASHDTNPLMGYAPEGETTESLRKYVLRELVNELAYVDCKLFKKGSSDGGECRPSMPMGKAMKMYPWIRRSP